MDSRPRRNREDTCTAARPQYQKLEHHYHHQKQKNFTFYSWTALLHEILPFSQLCHTMLLYHRCQSRSSSLLSSGGVVEDAMVVDQGSRVNAQESHNRRQHHYSNRDVRHFSENSSRSDQAHRQGRNRREDDEEIITNIEAFLHSRAVTSREMVAQNMAPSYDQLFQTSQESEEFISLDELGPYVHTNHHSQAQRVSTSDTTAHLYPGNQNQQDPNAQQHERTYYNLSSATQDSWCAAVYSGNIGESSGAGELGSSAVAEEALPPAPTPSQTSTNNFSATGKSSGETSTTTTIKIISRNDNARRRKISNIGTKTTTTTTTSSSTIEDNRSNSQSKTQRAELKNKSAMLPEQGSASGHHYNHQLHHPHLHHHHHHHCLEVEATPSHEIASEDQDDFTPVSRKRKISCHDDNDLPEETGDDFKSTRPNVDNKKQNHSEIEKRRRDKINTYITEISAMVPMCHAMSRKLDKLTVLRMAVQHLKTILGAVTSYTEGHYKPTFLSDQELKTLILQAAEGFVFVVGCDRGRILYVSESVSQTLNYTQDDLLGQSWFDILHPKDVAKVKEQLSSSDLSPRERLIDAKTMLPVKTDIPQGVSRLCPGARRSFFCRMKRKVDASMCGTESQVKEEADATTGCHRRKKQQNGDWKYCVIHCTGYLKSWAPAKMGLEEQEGDADGDGEGCNISCLVAVGRIQPGLPVVSLGPSTPKLKSMEFISRHAIDGKFLFVDQRATLVLGFLPQELLGTSMYEYYHHDDISHLADSHKAALQTPERVITRMYRFRTKGASFAKLQSEWKSFRNPWTKDIEYLISKNFAVYCDTRQVESSVNRGEGSSVQENYDYYAQSNGGLERLISSHVEMSKIGRKIAEEVMDRNQRRNEDSCSISSPNSAPDRTSLNAEFQKTSTVSPGGIRNVSQAVGIGSENNSSSSNHPSTYNQIRNNVQLNSIANDQGAQSDEDMMEIIGGTAISESPNPLPSDGNDEAAMAVIMSLLEADAGLGGPVDFSGLPWPLP